MSQWAFYTWRKKYQELMVSKARRHKALEKENRRLKQLVADLSLDSTSERMGGRANDRPENGNRIPFLS